MEETETDLSNNSDCNICQGTGTCDMCEGSGSVYDYDAEGNAILESQRECTHCTSPGYKMGDCSYCRGTGKFNAAFHSSPGTHQRMQDLDQIRQSSDHQIHAYSR